jgi:uncharacterized protein (TIGR03792 family)
MMVEWLVFDVAPALQERFIREDEAIWTGMLSQWPGFVSKEIWRRPNRAGELVIAIRWESLAHWKAIPRADLDETERWFQERMGRGFPILDAGEYEILKG